MNRDFYLVKTHINNLRPHDTVMHDGFMKTICPNNLKFTGFMGRTLFGDSYQLGHKPVDLVVFKTPAKETRYAR